MEKTLFQSFLVLLTLPPLYYLIQGLVGGKIHLSMPFDQNINRYQNPVAYWVTIGINLLLLCAALVVLFWVEGRF